MNQLRTQVIHKLNAIVELVRHCATKALPTQNQSLMQEVTLAVITHDGLCKLFEQDGPTENVVSLINEFGKAVAELYKNISTFKPSPASLPKIGFPVKKTDKTLLN